MPSPPARVDELLAALIVKTDHPEIASVVERPGGPGGWCGVRVDFTDGSAVYINTGKR